MELEIRIAVEFLLSFVVKKFQDIDKKGFVEVLIKTLSDKFKGHWYPEQPCKGSAYRCISLNDQLDNVLIRSAKETGFDLKILQSSLPLRLNVWIDPKEISYRIGEHGSVTQIYREDDDELNSTSEYAVAILKTLPSKNICKHEELNKPRQMVNHHQNQNRKSPTKDTNRLSPTARSFVSRRSPPLPIQVQHTTIAGPVFTSKPLANWDPVRKTFWQPSPVYDQMQAHNYILAHEIARFEAHMQAQRIALQTHYYKSPFHQVRRQHIGQYHKINMPNTPPQNNGHLRVQVVA